MKTVKAKYKFEKETRQNPLNIILIVYFLQTRLFTETIHGRPLSIRVFSSDRYNGADSVSLTIASSDKFKPIKIGVKFIAEL